MAPSPQPFQLSIPETALVDLKARLAMTCFPDQAPDGPWAYGTDLEYMRSLPATGKTVSTGVHRKPR
jgi:microsomal epoxide hydrolase